MKREDVKRAIQHYREFAKAKPDIFVKYTWSDLLRFARGEDYNGAISDGAVPNLGSDGWFQVVLALEDTFEKSQEIVSTVQPFEKKP
tara:strand:- start:142 stop:402 length:261 start_codon:yes stop_codon:yes gene_type:complete